MKSKVRQRNAKTFLLKLLTAVALVASYLFAGAQVSRAQSSAAACSNASAANETSAASTKPEEKRKPKGVVWVNTATGVYHRQGSRRYGKTKKGKYMLEEDAIKAGYKLAK